MKHVGLLLTAALFVNVLTMHANPQCDIKALKALHAKVPDTKDALDKIGDCLTAADEQQFFHNDGSTYTCKDDASQSEDLRLANAEIHLAALETDNMSFCCSEEECKANCPGTYTSTCNPDCKTPHPPALLTTMDPEKRIQNVAERIIALLHGSSCDSDNTNDSGDDSGTDDPTTSGSGTTPAGIDPSKCDDPATCGLG